MNTFIGKIKTTYRHSGFVQIPETDRFVEITGNDLNTALNYDTVEVEITKDNQSGDSEGRVLRIVKRSKIVFVGQIKKIWKEEKKAKVPVFLADGRGFYPNPEISDADSHGNLDGKKIVLELEKWTDPKHEPRMRIKKVLGKVGDNETEMQAAVIDRGMVIGFPPEVDAAANKIKEESKQTIAAEYERRRDMRDRLMFTIDPFDAKDFDDALSYKRLENGNYEIGIHIADPSFFVTEGSVLDDAAYERATSIYLVDRTIPMLPEVLSNDLCSLNPHEEKLTFSAVFEMTNDAQVVDSWFGETITISDHRFTYQDAQEVLDAGEGTHHEALSVMAGLATIMKRKKVANGAIEFDSVEVKFKLDDKSWPIAVEPKERLFTMEMIEEFMLLANREVSRFISVSEDGEPSEKPFIYRVHDTPKAEKVAEAAAFLKAIGFEADIDTDGVIASKEINRILKAHKGSELEGMISMTLLRSMNKATYSTKNIGHYGLGFKYYSHFTSPIRRYPDLMAHRLLRRYLSGEDVAKSEKKLIQEQAEHSSDMEVKAVEAERESIKFKYAQFFSDKIGDELIATVFRVTKHGILIEDKKTKASGMISVRAMGGDFYQFDEKAMTLRGKNSGRVFKTGSTVKAKVLGTNIEKKQIDFELVDDLAKK